MDAIFYNNLYDQFDKQNFNPRIKKSLSIIKNLVKNSAQNSKKSILDIGCKGGYISSNLKKWGGVHTIGIDVSKKALEDAKKVCNEVHLVTPNQQWPIEENSVDIVYAGEIIEHLFKTEQFLLDMYRVTKKDGYLVLTTPNIAWYINRFFFFLFGWQPIRSEVGATSSHYGNPLGKLIANSNEVAGHIRPFTYLSLKQMIQESPWKISKIYGSTDIRKKGFSQFDTLVSSFFPSLSSTLIVVCQKV